MKKIPLIRPKIDETRVRLALKDIAKTGMLTKGKYLHAFEEKLAKILGKKYAYGVTSCTTALHLALVAGGIKAGDEVLVSDFSFPASGNVVVHIGAKPVFIDIDLKTFCMDPVDLEKKITKKSKAIIVVHAFGYPAPMEKIAKIAKKHNLFLIEDAACAIGTKYRGKYLGAWGDASCFSFHPRKVVTTGEGGAIVTDSKVMAEKIEILKNHGSVVTDCGLSFIEAGYNYRLSEIQAAMGLPQLENLGKIIKNRQKVARKLIKLLSKIPGLVLPAEPKDVDFNFQSFVITLPQKVDRNKIIEKMRKNNVETTIGTYALHREPAYRKYGYRPGDLKNSEYAYHHTLTLPLFEDLTDRELDLIAQTLKDALNA
jgi:perosamine synthetase